MQRCMGCMREFGASYDVCPHCGYIVGTAPVSMKHLPPGTVLQGRYILGRSLGQGGFGITYIAWDNNLGRAVAVKEYMPNAFATRATGEKEISCYNEESKRQFEMGLRKTQMETHALAQFSNLESVVRVYDCIEENRTAYIIMELLRGRTVKEIVAERGRLSFSETMRIMTPILKTLDAMHKADMIHRDVAPDNIIVCDDGRIKLLDFGAARVVSTIDDKTRSVVLKHGYAPFEQYRSKGGQGAFTDVYAASATMYKMLTGETPPDSLDRDAQDTLRPISDFAAIPAAAEKAILRGMAVRPEKRTRTPAQLLSELERALPADPADAQTTRTPKKKQPKEKPPKEAQTDGKTKKSFTIKVLAAVVVVALIVTAVAVAARNGPDVETTTSESAAVRTDVPAAESSYTVTEQASDAETTEPPATEIPMQQIIAAAGDVISFGSYPQSIVKDAALIAELNVQGGTWKSYGYYSGTGSYVNGKMAASDYMQYRDVTYKGSQYRAVTFDKYRPFYTGEKSSAQTTYQDDNGYVTGHTYWFKYEPLQWRVLDPDTGLVLCETIIDSQPYDNYVLKENQKYYGDAQKKAYANNYEKSSLRLWLNDDFLNTAFTPEQGAQIDGTTISNNAFNTSYSVYDSASTTDKLFLLSYSEAQNADYNFHTKSESEDPARKVRGSDYAKCQGLWENESNDCSTWWLRSAGSVSSSACMVGLNGWVYHNYGCFVNGTGIGVLPACRLHNLSSDSSAS